MRAWDDVAALAYAAEANAAGKGLFGPSVKTGYRDPVCDALCERGVMRLVEVGKVDDRGYWIVDPTKR